MKRVLIVEANKSGQPEASYVFEHLNVTADLAGSLGSVVQHLQEHTYDVAIVDIQNTTLDSMEINTLIKEQQPGTTTLALTSDTDGTSREYVLSRGFDDIFFKPFNFAELMKYLS